MCARCTAAVPGPKRRLTRSSAAVIRKPLDKCFIHMLCEVSLLLTDTILRAALRRETPVQVNPKLAERLESSPKLQGEHQRSRKPLVASYLNQARLAPC